ncbi:hypothetical protein H7347_07210 [Corynebacterium sp. zg-331]|uniref:Gp37-like protein n=1 Tax=unclassified Corynebacterium TaxID=2624378 RepID=UPI001642A858|nr:MULTISPECIES: hypothetical protein [unclassified Corynebacterium]MBC3186361.1 hypothetical protein [Corynebacterium sp. zg-331]
MPERVEVTWALKGAGTCVLEAPLTATTALLLPADGQYLLVAHFNGLRHIGVPVETVAYTDDAAPHDPRIRVTTASGWSMLDAQHIPPVPDKPLSQQESAEYYTLSGPVETVVKRLVSIGSDRIGHPIVVPPDLGRGPQRTVRARLDTTADLVEDVLRESGFQLRLDGWLPGDPPVGGMQLPTAPVLYAQVEPLRHVDGLVWSVAGEDIASWEQKNTRPSATQVIILDRGEGIAQRMYPMRYAPVPSPWARREVTAAQRDEKDNLTDVGNRALEGAEATTSTQVTVSPGPGWEFGADGAYPRQYQVGDYVQLDIPELGRVEQVITEVVVELTPVSLTVSPKVGTPDDRR